MSSSEVIVYDPRGKSLTLKRPPAPVVLDHLDEIGRPGALQNLQDFQEIPEGNAWITCLQPADGLLAEPRPVAQLLLGDAAPNPRAAQGGAEALGGGKCLGRVAGHRPLHAGTVYHSLPSDRDDL